MKKAGKILAYIIGGLLLILVLVFAFFSIKWKMASAGNMKLLGQEAPVLNVEGHQFRDLNKNGKLDIYEDRRAGLDERVADLTRQMNLEEKAGLMFITMIGMKPDGSLGESPNLSEPLTFMLESNSAMLAKKHMNHFNILQSPSAEALLNWNNNIQKLAERTRLGIPVTIASDPRHGSPENPGASIPTPFFSKWCSPLGFAAIGDTALTRAFGDIARQEYMAVGIRLALSPMADLATEPRWARINGTFGEDAGLSAAQVKAYINGFQGDSLGAQSVACMVKHFAGGGPQKDGLDAHFPYGKDQVYPGNNFDYHLIPFVKGAFAAHAAQVMPYYGVPVGQTSEDLGFGYNKEIITGLLREKYGFDGVVCTDWGLVSDSPAKPAAAYGVENLPAIERAAKILEAGCDMFGGEASPGLIVELVGSGKITEERIDRSVKRILRDKFRLGLFDNPYLQKEKSVLVGNPRFMAKGREAQMKSLVLLKNEKNILPLKKGQKIYVRGIGEGLAGRFSDVVADPENADVIVIKTATPYEPRSKYFLERFFHQGRLDFPEKEKAELIKLMKTKPTVTIITMDRPPVVPEINAATKALVADFHCQDEVVLELVFGKFKPSGKLPFELPSSMQAVREQKEDLPYDSKNPLYPFGFGLGY
ncbi:MAG TPA: glycoside hydrolase family 3 protein [Bacteroidetes bacterium]|nr:glycoside hydrolase family 3 protein [Bacteroidota bacterium]